MDEQLAMVAHLCTWYPDTRKSSFDQQLQNMFRIPTVRFLLPHIAGTNLSRIADSHFMVEFLQQLDKPLIIAHRFDAH
jgi:hypothetical protein